jgi:hypothetical protein
MLSRGYLALCGTWLITREPPWNTIRFRPQMGQQTAIAVRGAAEVPVLLSQSKPFIQSEN